MTQRILLLGQTIVLIVSVQQNFKEYLDKIDKAVEQSNVHKNILVLCTPIRVKVLRLRWT